MVSKLQENSENQWYCEFGTYTEPVIIKTNPFLQGVQVNSQLVTQTLQTLADSEKEIVRLSQSVASFKNSEAAYKHQINMLETTKANNIEKIKNLKATVTASNETVTKRNRTISTHLRTIALLTVEKTELVKKVENQTKTIRTTQLKLDTYEQNAQLKTYNIETLSKDKTQETKSLKTQNQKLNEKIANQKSNLKSLQAKVDSISLKNDIKSKELEIFISKLTQIKADMEKVKTEKNRYKRLLNLTKKENDKNETLIETLLHSKSDDVVDVRLVGQVYDLYKDKCKKLEEANAKSDSNDKTIFNEVRVEQASSEMVCLLYV